MRTTVIQCNTEHPSIRRGAWTRGRRMSAGSSDGTPAAGCFGGGRAGGGGGGGGVGCFGGKPEKAPLLDKMPRGTLHEASAWRHGGRPSGLDYQAREDTVSDEDDAEHGVVLGTQKPDPVVFSECDSARDARRGSWQQTSTSSEVRASSIRPALVVLAIAAAPFSVGLALGYPRAAAPTLLCGARTDHPQSAQGCASETRLVYLENITLAGALAGALLTGRACDLVGRRGVLRIAGALAVLGWVGGELGFGAGSRGGGIGRCLVGISAGAATVASTLLAAELASPGSRGALLATCQLALALGLVLMHAAALVASSAVGGVGGGFSGYDESRPGFHAFAERDAENGLGHPQPHWRQCALFAAAMSAAATACAGGLWGDARVWAIAPESPRWLAKRGRDAEVVKAIATVRGLCETDDAVLEEARLVIREVGGGGPSSCFSISHLLTRGSLSKQVVKCLALVLVTTCGGLAFSFRNVSLANVSGFEDTDTSAFAASCFKLFGIALCAFLLKAQKCGRRVLLLASLCGMTLCDVCVVCSLVLSPPDSALGKTGDTIRTLVPLAFNFAFGAGAATIPWLVATEAFAYDARAAALGLLVAAHWSYLLDVGFGFRAATAGGSPTGGVITFGVFGMLCATIVSLVAPRGQKLVPETDGTSLEEALKQTPPGKTTKMKEIGIAQGF